MKRRFCWMLLCFVAILSCRRNMPLQTANLVGTWNYAGYSGGFAGFPFTPVKTQSPYLQFSNTSLLICDSSGKTKKCINYSLKTDSVNANYISGTITFSDTFFLLPEPTEKKYFLELKNNRLSLYPQGWADAFSAYYTTVGKSFDWCP
jgi:hypothetical protein